VEIEIESGVHRRASKAPTDRPAQKPFLERTPILTLDASELRTRALDHRAGFLVSLIDGSSTVETILDLCAMPNDDALKILHKLLSVGIVTLA
jgi:hypothetical protein